MSTNPADMDDNELSEAFAEVTARALAAEAAKVETDRDLSDAMDRHEHACARLRAIQKEARPFEVELAARRNRDQFGEKIARMIARWEDTPLTFQHNGRWYWATEKFAVLLPCDERPVGFMSTARSHEIAEAFAGWFAKARTVDPGEVRGVSRAGATVRMIDGRAYPDEQIELVNGPGAEFCVAELYDDEPILCMRVDGVPALASAPLARDSAIEWEGDG